MMSGGVVRGDNKAIANLDISRAQMLDTYSFDRAWGTAAVQDAKKLKWFSWSRRPAYGPVPPPSETGLERLKKTSVS